MRQPIFALLLIFLLSAGMTGCTSLPDQRQLRQMLGLEQNFAHNDVPAPASPAGYSAQFALGQTRRILVSMQHGTRKFEIHDPQTIHALVNIIRQGDQASSPTATLPQEPIQLTFLIGSPERSVTALYLPGTQLLHIYNVPSAALPDHAVAVYNVTPGFGAALLEALNTVAP